MSTMTTPSEALPNDPSTVSPAGVTPESCPSIACLSSHPSQANSGAATFTDL